MSQLNLTLEEDQLILSGLRSKATQYAAMFNSEDQAILDLIAKVEGQLPSPALEGKEPENETTEEEAHFDAEEKPTKAKKAK